MSGENSMFPRARIPYGTWGSSYFPAWQTSALAQVNIGQFAGESMARIMSLRNVEKSEIEYLIIGSTVPWHWKFWNAPLVSSCMGQRIPGFHMEQACATGLQAVLIAGTQVQTGANDVVGVCTFDRTSDSPVGVFPERRAYERTQALADVWDNFGFDPATGKAMIAAAGKTARKYRIDRALVDDISYCRYEQYFDAKDSGFLDRVLVPLDILDVSGKPLGRIEVPLIRGFGRCKHLDRQRKRRQDRGRGCRKHAFEEISSPNIDFSVRRLQSFFHSRQVHHTEIRKKNRPKDTLLRQGCQTIKVHGPARITKWY